MQFSVLEMKYVSHVGCEFSTVYAEMKRFVLFFCGKTLGPAHYVWTGSVCFER